MAPKEFSEDIYFSCPKWACCGCESMLMCGRGNAFWENTTGHGPLLWRLRDKIGSAPRGGQTLGTWLELAKIHKRLTSVIQWKTTATWQEKQGGWAHSLPVVNNMETYLKTMRRLCLRDWKYLKVLFLLQAELWVNRDVPLWTLTRNKGNEPDSSTVSRLLPKRLFPPLYSAR